MAAITVPTAGTPILDSWGADVANRLNRLQPLALTSDLATNSATAQDIAALAVEMTAGRGYLMRFHGGYAVSATNQGLLLGFSAPSGGGALDARIWGNGGPTTEGRVRTTSGTLVGLTATDTTGEREFWLDIWYVATASGTFTPQFARGGTSGGTGVTLRAGVGGLVIETA